MEAVLPILRVPSLPRRRVGLQRPPQYEQHMKAAPTRSLALVGLDRISTHRGHACTSKRLDNTVLPSFLFPSIFHSWPYSRHRLPSPSAVKRHGSFFSSSSPQSPNLHPHTLDPTPSPHRRSRYASTTYAVRAGRRRDLERPTLDEQPTIRGRRRARRSASGGGSAVQGRTGLWSEYAKGVERVQEVVKSEGRRTTYLPSLTARERLSESVGMETVGKRVASSTRPHACLRLTASSVLLHSTLSHILLIDSLPHPP
ncbi:hypothetical protein R3P38DRAFT_3201535 [Favolaschia claudopus]|uniref:Uncharacterized protein n=1 Tax=Favolaschia claudopus TaxID=2862362 RepID=A0AAW0AV95_9AGAR